MSTLDAALAYAEARLYILPTKPGDHAGSLVGKGWPARSSRDPDVIREWWGRWPDASIALHVGRSGLVAFDVDRPEKVPEILGRHLKAAKPPVQDTRTDGADKGRGHYLFQQPPGRSIGNGWGGLPKGWGEVRGTNGVLVVEPSAHAKAGSGGCYRWRRTGVVPELPDELADSLNDSAEPEAVLSDAELETFIETYLGTDPKGTGWRPGALKGPVNWCAEQVDAGASRHETMVPALCWAFREAISGAYPARTAHDALARVWREAWANPGHDGRQRPARDELASMASWSAAQALQADPDKTRERMDRDAEGEVKAENTSPFTRVSARELAAPVPPMQWLVRGWWALNSFGPMGGKKKTLKTYNLMAMALAVASGEPLFGHFEVHRPGPVVLYIAEGGREPFQRRAQRVADAYKIDLADLEPNLRVVFGMAPLNSAAFLDGLRRDLDEMQPVLFALDPLYAYHPHDVTAENLYTRGPMLQKLRADVGEDLSMVVPDHFNKSSGDGLDLDDIGYAGWAATADSWVLQGHRSDPDLINGEYKLKVEVGSRQWGGSQYAIDWNIPQPLDELDASERADYGCPDRITWSVEKGAGAASSQGGERLAEKNERRVRETVEQNPFDYTTEGLVKVVGGNAGKVRDAIERLAGEHRIEQQDVVRPDASGRNMPRKRWGIPDNPKMRFRVAGDTPFGTETGWDGVSDG